MTNSPQSSHDPLDHDLTCIACGYNLRGLLTHGHCPECNAPIAASVEAAADLRTDPVAVRCIIRSLRIVLVANSAAIVVLLAASQFAHPVAAWLAAAGGVCIVAAGLGWAHCIHGFAPRGQSVARLPFIGSTGVIAAFFAFNVFGVYHPTKSSLHDFLPDVAAIPIIFLSIAMVLWGAFARVGLLIDINSMLRDRRIRAFGNHNGFIIMFVGLVIWPLGVIMYLYITGRVLLATIRAARAAGMRS